MGRHRAVRHNRIPRTLRRAVVVSAVTASALTLPATAALAAPGSGSMDSAGSESLGSGSGSGSMGSGEGSLGSAEGSVGSLGSLDSLNEGGSMDASGQLPVPSPRAVAALGVSMTQAGKPYEWGATGPDTYDCSGLVQWAYAQLGMPIGRTTYDQIYEGVAVPVENMQPGDLIIFREDNSHIGIYAGFGQVWNAYDYGVPIGMTPLEDEPPISMIRRVW